MCLEWLLVSVSLAAFRLVIAGLGRSRTAEFYWTVCYFVEMSICFKKENLKIERSLKNRNYKLPVS